MKALAAFLTCLLLVVSSVPVGAVSAGPGASDAPTASDFDASTPLTQSDGSTLQVSAPPLQVAGPNAQIELNATGLVAQTRNPATVTLSNPTTTPMRNVTVTVGIQGGDAVVARQTVPVLAAGASQELSFALRPNEAGERRVTVRAFYTVNGDEATTRYRESVRVSPLEDDVAVRVESAQSGEAQQDAGGQLGALLGGGGGQGALQQSGDGEAQPGQIDVVVTNFGNAPIRNVVVVPVSNGTELPRQSIAGPLAPGESARTTVDLSFVGRQDSVTFEARYRVGGRDSTARTEFPFDPASGSISLTNVNLSMGRDGVLRITGNAGNPGEGSVRGVTVSVGDAEHVTPTYPVRDYFVGTIDGNEFAPFDLTAEVDRENVTVVPVDVTYVTNGVRYTETVELPYDRSLSPPERERGILAPLSTGASTLVALLGVSLVAVAALVVVRRRR
ncbi:CARDB domain-containing protein [Haloprofundus marisrubri]|nr:CARDB domain-containing protein [Haloprofundus marisrubri]